MTKSISRVPAVILAACLMVATLMGASMIGSAYAAGNRLSPNSGGFVTKDQSVPSMGQNLSDFPGEAENVLMRSNGGNSLFGDSELESIMDQLDDDHYEDDWPYDTGSFAQDIGTITIILLIVFGVFGIGLNLIGGLLLISAWRNARMGRAIAGSILFTVSMLISFNLFSMVAAILGWAGVIASSVANRPQDNGGASI